MNQKTPPGAAKHARLPLHWKMAIGFVAGLVLGLVAYYASGADAGRVQWLTTNVTQPAGALFLRLIFMLVIPLLFSALVVGIAEMGDVRSLGRVGWRTLAYTVVVSGIAVVIGLLLVNWLEPGVGIDPVAAQQMLSEGSERASAIVRSGADQPQGLDMLLSIVPSNVVTAAADNSILAVMFFALMVGIGLVMARTPAADSLQRAIEGLFDVSMTLIGLVIRLAPYAVFCFMFNLAALFGWDLLVRLGAYVGVVVLALSIHMLVVYSLALRFVGGYSPVKFFRNSQEAMVMAFSTASSNATLPTALRVSTRPMPIMIAKNITARIALSAAAVMTLLGTIDSSMSMPCGWPALLLTIAAARSEPSASICSAAARSMPTPGFSQLTSTSPITTAMPEISTV